MKATLVAEGPLHRRQLDHATRTANPHARRYPRLVKAAPKLWADKAAGTIGYGETLLLSGIPADAWRYQLGTRSALEWVLDQHQDRTPKDPTIRAKFATYRVADHLEELTLLLRKVITVSVETMEIVDKLAAISPLNPGNAAKQPHVRPAPTTPQEAKQLLFDFSQPAEPVAPPETFTLALSREESDFYLAHYQGPHDGDALECLLERHGHAWDARVQEYGVTQYWQGIKAAAGSWVTSLVLVPC